MKPADVDRWLRCRRPVQACRARLLCLPYAGGGATVFHAWPDELPADIEVRVLQLPGRQDRLGEPTLSSIDAIVDKVLPMIAALPRAPLVLYGHSFGGLLGFELARRIQRSGMPPVELLVIGARRAPHLPARLVDLHGLPDAPFAEALHQRYGMPRVVIDTPDLLELVLPSARADLTAVETHVYAPGEPLGTPVVVLRGLRDTSLELSEVEGWRELVAGPVEIREVDAGHFFVDTHRPWVVREVAQILTRVTPKPA
ncbi:MAG TPA: alpha/beta fold hydrolase [Kofleriaceae bacterium]|nr:alpha/beta fold hydrolase [Kofleriaceae bacterium]